MDGYYTPGGGLGLSNLGLASDRAAPPALSADGTSWTSGPGLYVWSLLSLVGTGSGAYHGYKRNRGSVGWAIGWALLGGLFPVITIPVSLAQGYGKPKVSRNRRRPRRNTARRTSRPRRRTSRRTSR